VFDALHPYVRVCWDPDVVGFGWFARWVLDTLWKQQQSAGYFERWVVAVRKGGKSCSVMTVVCYMVVQIG
jgi:hypothetical protein